MRSLIVTLGVLFFAATAFAASSGSSVMGHWKTVDDKTHKTESVMRVWEQDGKLYGAIEKLIGMSSDAVCDRCSGDLKNKKMEGMTLMWGLTFDGKAWDKGQIMDPKDGKVYRCKVELDDDGALKVRGYLGIAAFGRTQKWYRAE
jgi:uncharacterized protein (DUF2147 family)